MLASRGKNRRATDIRSSTTKCHVNLFVYNNKSNGPLLSNTVIGTLVDGWAVTLTSTWAFQKTRHWTHKIQDERISAILKIDMTSFVCRARSDLDEIWQSAAERHADCGDTVEIETKFKRLCVRIGHYGAIQMLYYYYYY